MLKILLYVVATFMETSIGIWIFGKMFPKRKCMEKKHYLSEGLFFTIIMVGAYSFPNLFIDINDIHMYSIILCVIYIAILLFVIIYKFKKRIWSTMESDFIKWTLFVAMIIMLSCQYWISYESAIATLQGNALPVLFLFVFFECTIVKAYLWQLLYLTNLGLLKMVYITYEGSFGNRLFEEFLYPPRFHSYSEIVYWLAILGAIIILFQYIPVNRILQKILNEYKKQLFLVEVCEWTALMVLMNYGIGEIKKEDLAITLTIVVIILIGFFFAVIRLLGKAIEAERNLLDVRNEAVESQYRELRESYDKYRCLLHDEKHMIFYLKECLDNGRLEEGKRFLSNYQDNIVNTEKRSWTGIVTLDFVLNVKMRKIEELNIDFHLDSRVESIPMEDADFVVVLANLFDNAIEACGKCKADNRIIELSVQSVNQMFLLKIKNSCLSEPSMKNNRFITDKKEKNKHGWGIESVKHIVEKYEGQIAFDFSCNVFSVSIIINEN